MWMLFIPFVVLVLLYFLIFNIYGQKPVEATVPSAIFKCLPIICLLAMVQVTPKISSDHDSYKFYVSLGLALSTVGDFMLNWMSHKPAVLLPGIGCFALAQISYTIGFGFDPFGGQTALMLGVAALLMMYVFIPDVKPRQLRPFVVIYVVLIAVMGWRATARYKETRSLDTWLAMAGAVCFVVSDFSLAFNKWKSRIPRALFLIMVTYYLAQVLIAGSVIVPTWQALKKFSGPGFDI